MDVTAHSITRFVQAKIHNVDLWASPYQELEETLQQVRIEHQQNLLKSEVQGPKYPLKKLFKVQSTYIGFASSRYFDTSSRHTLNTIQH